MSVFKNQSLLTITAKTNYPDLASAEVKRILYTKPGGAKGYWEAEASGTNLVYHVQSGDINIAGWWELEAYIEVGGLKGPGDVAKVEFKKTLL